MYAKLKKQITEQAFFPVFSDFSEQILFPVRCPCYLWINFDPGLFLLFLPCCWTRKGKEREPGIERLPSNLLSDLYLTYQRVSDFEHSRHVSFLSAVFRDIGQQILSSIKIKSIVKDSLLYPGITLPSTPFPRPAGYKPRPKNDK